jgi:hypothetical protein
VVDFAVREYPRLSVYFQGNNGCLLVLLRTFVLDLSFQSQLVRWSMIKRSKTKSLAVNQSPSLELCCERCCEGLRITANESEHGDKTDVMTYILSIYMYRTRVRETTHHQSKPCVGEKTVSTSHTRNITTNGGHSNRGGRQGQTKFLV